jgi:hypothetical protein
MSAPMNPDRQQQLFGGARLQSTGSSMRGWVMDFASINPSDLADLAAAKWARRWDGDYAHEARGRHFTVLVT